VNFRSNACALFFASMVISSQSCIFPTIGDRNGSARRNDNVLSLLLNIHQCVLNQSNYFSWSDINFKSAIRVCGLDVHCGRLLKHGILRGAA
jgi:hypothetical protein